MGSSLDASSLEPRGRGEGGGRGSLSWESGRSSWMAWQSRGMATLAYEEVLAHPPAADQNPAVPHSDAKV